ncbi:dcp2, box A domain-containing protein [Hirsutella rhossiliensis]|uniref:Dcp2, box A domain-containing protein n=1 Tax=Hirsutella rhossiliensis TaxID=111463 RepID=A0A9P8MRI0_9HYPO|nr:dcp2, box A domain-containing protein [Hirsutella rhossiliensis]KAH0960548.1 dcp2, box A domain-containing protein [Hirsutella rhossiliensis]
MPNIPSHLRLEETSEHGLSGRIAMAGTQMQLEDWLDDLCVRFIINLPQEDLSSVARICFQVEEAQWFYEDFIRPLDPTLPSMSLRIFCLRIFQHCPLLASFSAEHHTKAFEEFLQYKTRVPVRGAIMLNQAMDSVVLVKGWKKGASWSFPRGKINKDEDDLDCAIREVYEETGLDLRAAGLAPTEKRPKYIEISMREQQLRLYVFRDIPMATDFQPRTRKEISKIQWYKLSDLPTFRKRGDKSAQNRNDAGAGGGGSKFYMVAPFLAPSSGDATWAPGSVPNHFPAMEDFNGAKQRVERLFGTQPHIQGLEAPPHEDKGSALLSILQAGGQRGGTSHHVTPNLSPHVSLPQASSELVGSGANVPSDNHRSALLGMFKKAEAAPLEKVRRWRRCYLKIFVIGFQKLEHSLWIKSLREPGWRSMARRMVKAGRIWHRLNKSRARHRCSRLAFFSGGRRLAMMDTFYLQYRRMASKLKRAPDRPAVPTRAR